jgi:hypothetical protein
LTKQIEKNESQKIEAVRVQIKFRKKVLKMAPEEKNVLPFSSNSIQFSLNEPSRVIKCALGLSL